MSRRTVTVQEPTAGELQRINLTHELQKRGVKPAAIALEAKASAATVSYVLAGQRCEGDVVERVQQLVARILKQPVEQLFTVRKEMAQD